MTWDVKSLGEVLQRTETANPLDNPDAEEYGEFLAKPEELLQTSFDFYGEVLATQRKFATDLLAAAAPVVKVLQPVA